MFSKKTTIPFIKLLTIVLIIFSTPVTSLHAQNTPAKTTQPDSWETSPIRALAVGFEGDLREFHILDADNQSVGKLRLMLRSFSSEFTCPVTAGTIRFGVEDGVNEEGKTLYSVVAAIPWEPQFSEICLVFIPKAFTRETDLEQPYLVRRMDMSQADFELGTTRIVNLTPVTGYVSFGEHKREVEANQSVLMPKIEEVMRANMVQLSIYQMVNDAPHRVQETRVRYLERIRYLIILYPDFLHRRMGVASILDYGNLF